MTFGQSRAGRPIRLVINADDYGYFNCVSEGILAAAKAGAITATGVLTTTLPFVAYAPRLRELTGIDAGMHLTLSTGQPLTAALRDKLADKGGFPGKWVIAKAILAGQLGIAQLKAEWRAQLERALAAGLEIRFLNSHEHLHLLPALNRIIRELAAEYRIHYVRRLLPEWSHGQGAAVLVRNLVAGVMPFLHGSAGPVQAVPCLGLGPSGNLDLDYLQRRLPELVLGGVYELMCHPGYFDPAEIADPALRRYHAWESEMATLRHPGLKQLFAESGIELVRFRDLTTD